MKKIDGTEALTRRVNEVRRSSFARCVALASIVAVSVSACAAPEPDDNDGLENGGPESGSEDPGGDGEGVSSDQAALSACNTPYQQCYSIYENARIDQIYNWTSPSVGPGVIIKVFKGHWREEINHRLPEKGGYYTTFDVGVPGTRFFQTTYCNDPNQSTCNIFVNANRFKKGEVVTFRITAIGPTGYGNDIEKQYTINYPCNQVKSSTYCPNASGGSPSPSGGSSPLVPSVPGGLRAAAYSGTSGEIFWSPSCVLATTPTGSKVCSNEGRIVAYEVSRNGKVLVSRDAGSYMDKTMAPKTSYTFSVVAVDDKQRRSAPAKVVLTTR